MDFMKKFVRSNSNTPQNAPSSSSLGLVTLRRLFQEICLQPSTPAQQEEKIYNILPLFYQVFGNTSHDIRQRFGDVLQFSTMVSKLMVTEIRRRASNKSTEQASIDIANFLIPQQRSEAAERQGWLLLNVLYLLAAGNQSIVDCMTTSHLPSTLVKCLYLFFDLPVDLQTPQQTPSNEDKADENSAKNDSDSARNKDVFRSLKSLSLSRKRSSNVHPSGSGLVHADTLPIYPPKTASFTERLALLKKLFVQTVVRLCGHISPAEELSYKDDLALIFSAITSWCAPHNVQWQSAAAEVLVTISRHGLSHNVVQYIRSKQCIKTSINNLWRATVSPADETDSDTVDAGLCEQLMCVVRFVSNTSEVTQLLLDDFKQCQGYIFMTEFLLRLEGAATTSEKHREGSLSVVGGIESLVMCGFNELKPESVPKSQFVNNFVIPSAVGKGESVRNILAFQVLETAFTRSQTTLLSRAILDAIFNIYCRDPANYFILLSENTLCMFSEKLPHKPSDIFSQYFVMFEYVVLSLGYIPRKELVSLSLLLKVESNIECAIMCLKSLHKLLTSLPAVYCNVFREVGLLEMHINCLHRYSAQLKASDITEQNQRTDHEALTSSDHLFGNLAMGNLVNLLSNSPVNASIFRETGGARCAFNTISYSQSRSPALSLVKALILQPVDRGNDDDMGTLLGLLCTLSIEDIQLKVDILQSLCEIVSLNNEISVMFRNAGGFINIISVLVEVEGGLSHPPTVQCASDMMLVYQLLEVIFKILAVVMRLSSNERYFENEVQYGVFRGALKRLGCFTEEANFPRVTDALTPNPSTQLILSEIFDSNVTLAHLNLSENCEYRKTLIVFRFLFQLATDSFKCNLEDKILNLQLESNSVKSHSSHSKLSKETPYIQHPKCIKLMLQLISFIAHNGLTDEKCVELQVFLLKQINKLLDIERNAQILAEDKTLSTFLKYFLTPLTSEETAINPICETIVERLARQSISPKELRKLLRVGSPLHCSSALLHNGSCPLFRVKSLVAVATPRNAATQWETSVPFIEFDMSYKGCSSLFLPSLFPQAPPNQSVVGGGSLVPVSGLGTEERIFPPSPGLLISAWVYINTFCSLNVHPVRIITVTRKLLATNQEWTCFSVQISPKERNLLVSTYEENVQYFGSDNPQAGKEGAEFNTSGLLTDKQWHHIQITLQKSTVLKHSTATAYVDGKLVDTAKLRYIHTFPGGYSQQSLNSTVQVNAYVGSPRQCSARSSLSWRLAALTVVDELPSNPALCASVQHKLGPSYIGNYQRVTLADGNVDSLFPEEHICFAFQPKASKNLSIPTLWKTCQKIDVKSVINELELDPSNDLKLAKVFVNSSPVLSAGKPYGAFAVGDCYREAPRGFVPEGISHVLQDVGGVSVCLELVSMATDIEGLYAAVKFLVCVVKSDHRGALEMEKNRGYQTLGMHLKGKRNLLNTNILHLSFSLAGSVDSNHEATSIGNLPAFEDLLCDLEVWHNAPYELQKSLFDHFLELLNETSESETNHRVFREIGMLFRFVNFLYSDQSLTFKTTSTVLKVVQSLVTFNMEPDDIVCVGQFAVSLITVENISEREVIIHDGPLDYQDTPSSPNISSIDANTVSTRTISLRNSILSMFIDCFASSNDTIFFERFETSLGLDWVLLFTQSNLHQSTVQHAIKLLFVVLQSNHTLPNTAPTNSIQPSNGATVVERFRNGEVFGGWLKGTDEMVNKRIDSLLGFNMRSSNESFQGGLAVLKEATVAPGFLLLQHNLACHACSYDIIMMLLSLFVDEEVGVDSSEEIFEKLNEVSYPKLSEKQSILKTEILQLFFSMLRFILQQETIEDPSHWTNTHPRIIMDIMTSLYNVKERTVLFYSCDVITSIISSLFPSSNSNSFKLNSALTFPPLNQNSFSNHLTTHPIKSSIFKFINTVLWEAISLPKNKSSVAVIDAVIDATVDKATTTCNREYFGEVLSHILNHPHYESAMKTYHVATTITYLTSKVVDKVWQNFLPKDTSALFKFISNLILICHNKPSLHALDSLYKSLYRFIFFNLSRQHFAISEQMAVLEVLHWLTSNRNIVFGPKMNEINFLSCLCHCLFEISGDGRGQDFGLEAELRQTTWHVTSPDKDPSLAPSPHEKGQLLLSQAAARVWSELVASKKNALADHFKVTFHDLGSNQSNLDQARLQVREAANRSWSSYLATERKAVNGSAKESPLQQQKLMKRMSSAITSGKKTKRDTNIIFNRNLNLQDNTLWTLNHISVVRSLIRIQSDDYKQDQRHVNQFASKEWSLRSQELQRECGLWGPRGSEPLTKWALDSTEGPCRMRKRMARDEHFYERYPHRSALQLDTLKFKHKKPTSSDSVEYYRRINCLSPYYDPDAHQQVEAARSNDDVFQTNGNTGKVGKEINSREEENEDATVLNVCLVCRERGEGKSEMKTDFTDVTVCDLCGCVIRHAALESVSMLDGGVDGDEQDSPEPKENQENSTDSETKQPENSEIKTEKISEISENNSVKNSPNNSEIETNSDVINKDNKADSSVSKSQSNLSDIVSQDQEKPDNQTILKLLEKGEKIRSMFRSARVEGLDVHEGLLLFGRDHYYIIDGFTMLKSREIRDISLLQGEHDPIIPSATRSAQESAMATESKGHDRMCSKFAYNDIREVHKRRYLLQNIALEVFNKDGTNYLLVVPQGTRSKVYNKFFSYATTLSDRGKDSISGQRSGLNIEQQGPTLLTSLIGEKTVTSRWERGEMSNFQYLMHLNTLAGRSYNDLMQYPVFPWIIRDYTSQELDLCNPETFRDLSRPMGAQSESRLDQYKKRYKDWEELGAIETPPYHYGTHYSSAMIVASYLVRMEPFTQHFLRLQGGHFDLADRMFHSIKDSWFSASQKNMADVKELIPEFFYLPEFLLNSNRFDLGQKQNGVQLNDVVLPEWARGSPHEFIRAHREALECDFVSQHLHEWIDLIFGYKQQGEVALDSHNVFHHLFYEGEVDIYSIKDPLQRNATIGFINNFGQIPKQLFKRPHPQKKQRWLKIPLEPYSIGSDKVFYRQLDNLKHSPNPTKELSSHIGCMVVHDRGVFVTGRGKTLIPPLNTRYIGWGNPDSSVRVGYYESEKPLQIFENLRCGEITCAVMATETLFITGDRNTVVNVWEIPALKDRNKTMTLIKSLYGHTKPVTSVAACSGYSIIVTGSEDGSCIVWDLNHLAFVRQLLHQNSAEISHVSINEKTGNILTSSDANLCLWSINGQLIAFASALSSNVRHQKITALESSYLNEWDPHAVICTGHSDGYVRFWGIEHVQVPESSSQVEQDLLMSSSLENHKLQGILNHADSTSLCSVGELAIMPWPDIAKVELSTEDAKKKNETTQLAPGFRWKQQLVLKGKIELPAFTDKSSNSYIPKVAAITISKDHHKLYVGDSEGRVYTWTST